MTYGDFSSRIVLVTGAAGEIGRSISRQFVDLGAMVIAVDVDGDALDSLAGDVSALVPVYADAVDEASVSDYVTDILRTFGSIDVLCNNVGAEGTGSEISTCSSDEVETLFQLNALSAFLNTKAVVPSMQMRRRGAIVNVSSISGVVGNPNDVAYTMSKHALIGLTKACASELGCYGIRVNSVSPGPIESVLMQDFEQASPAGSFVREWYERNTPLGRYGRSSEVAAAVAFLASDASSFTTGSNLVIDGGLTSSARIGEVVEGQR